MNYFGTFKGYFVYNIEKADDILKFNNTDKFD